MYSDSVVERATELCFFDDHDAAPPAMWIRPGFLSKFSFSNFVEVRMPLFGLADVLVDPPVDPPVADPLTDSWDPFAVDSCNKI